MLNVLYVTFCWLLRASVYFSVLNRVESYRKLVRSEAPGSIAMIISSGGGRSCLSRCGARPVGWKVPRVTGKYTARVRTALTNVEGTSIS